MEERTELHLAKKNNRVELRFALILNRKRTQLLEILLPTS